MQINRHRTRQLLKASEFEPLLVEELGWDYHTQRLNVTVDETEYLLTAIVEKRGMAVFICSATADGSIPNYATRRKIQREVAKSAHEHLIIYTDAEKTTQIWQWVKREPGKPVACREHRYHGEQSGESLIQKLGTIAFSIEEEESLTLVDVTGRVRAGFDVERVTKRFYDRFKREHALFLKFLKGIPDQEMQRWYASVMLNRLMFIYFIQEKGFLNSDGDYLRTKLTESKTGGRDRYYTTFLCPLFFEGFAKPESERSREANRLLGKVPYLNGGIFQRHQLEELHGVTPLSRGEDKGGSIQIADAAFEGLFNFFEAYQWHLDERPLRNDNEINPDVLGYIFEKYINQKQMGAYYTKEDITEYISKNTIIPSLFDAAREACKIAFESPSSLESTTRHTASVWQLLGADPDRYIYPAVKRGVKLDLPPEIAAGIDDVSKRTAWNTPAPDQYALPTEIWREVVARRCRYESIHAKLSNGEIDEVNALITHNLDIRQFAHDVIENCEGPELLRAFWKAITQVTILDPTCGSGAFLFAALNILEPLYEACLDRMEVFLDELQYAVKKPHPEKFSDFREVLEHIEQHPNRRYFILKSIIINNLYGVDIMEEAIEICKLRLFLKMVAQIEDVRQIEPLPDIDFNIQAGNTLVGYATYDEVERAVTENRIDFDNTMKRIEEKAEDIEHLFDQFRLQQTELGGAVTPADKQVLRDKLKALEAELNRYLAGEYKVAPNKQPDYQSWLSSHKPFHWFIEFYGILKKGGFDVMIGNPPYVEYSKVKKDYTIRGYETESCGNLFAYMLERCAPLGYSSSLVGMIVPISAFSTDRMIPLIKNLKHDSSALHIANFSWRPGKLFDGVNLQLSIVLQTLGKVYPKIETTKYILWDSEARPELFSKIEFSVTKDERLAGSISKLGTAEAVTVLKKLRSRSSQIGNSFVNRSTNKVFYRRGGLYWKVFVDFETGSSEEKIIYLRPEVDKYAIIAVLSSNLWFWYFTITSDCRHLGKRDINTFSFDPREMSPTLYRNFCQLGREYVCNLKCNAELIVRVYKGKKAVECLNFRVKESKSIIDEIDRVLAQHYGFTDEELDFIINYDIKYRMGLGNE